MRVKCPDELEVGDRLWFWCPRGWATVTEIVTRRGATAVVRLDDLRTVEIYTKMIVP